MWEPSCLITRHALQLPVRLAIRRPTLTQDRQGLRKMHNWKMTGETAGPVKRHAESDDGPSPHDCFSPCPVVCLSSPAILSVIFQAFQRPLFTSH